MGTIADRVKDILPESLSIEQISGKVIGRVADALALYDYESESELTVKQQIMISLEAALMLIPAVIDYYKSRATDTTVQDTRMAYSERIRGLVEISKHLQEQLKNVRAVCGYDDSEPPFEFKKAEEGCDFYKR